MHASIIDVSIELGIHGVALGGIWEGPGVVSCFWANPNAQVFASPSNDESGKGKSETAQAVAHLLLDPAHPERDEHALLVVDG